MQIGNVGNNYGNTPLPGDNNATNSMYVLSGIQAYLTYSAEGLTIQANSALAMLQNLNTGNPFSGPNAPYFQQTLKDFFATPAANQASWFNGLLAGGLQSSNPLDPPLQISTWIDQNQSNFPTDPTNPNTNTFEVYQDMLMMGIEGGPNTALNGDLQQYFTGSDGTWSKTEAAAGAQILNLYNSCGRPSSYPPGAQWDSFLSSMNKMVAAMQNTPFASAMNELSADITNQTWPDKPGLDTFDQFINSFTASEVNISQPFWVSSAWKSSETDLAGMSYVYSQMNNYEAILQNNALSPMDRYMQIQAVISNLQSISSTYPHLASDTNFMSGLNSAIDLSNIPGGPFGYVMPYTAYTGTETPTPGTSTMQNGVLSADGQSVSGSYSFPIPGCNEPDGDPLQNTYDTLVQGPPNMPAAPAGSPIYNLLVQLEQSSGGTKGQQFSATENGITYTVTIDGTGPFFGDTTLTMSGTFPIGSVASQTGIPPSTTPPAQFAQFMNQYF